MAANNAAWDNLDVKGSKRWDDYCDGFWARDDFNYRIDKLNKESPYGLKIRIEKNPPIIYCIGIRIPNDKTGVWRLCKIGLTQTDPSKPRNRMKIVRDKIRKAYPKEEPPELIFTLPIAATNTSSPLDVEDEVREKFGFKVNKEVLIAKKLILPNKTEWVLTTEAYITKIKESTDKSRATTDDVTKEENTFRVFLNEDNQNITEQFDLPDWLEICKESLELRLKPGYTVPKQTRKATPKKTPNKSTDKQVPRQDHERTTTDLDTLSSDPCKKKIATQIDNQESPSSSNNKALDLTCKGSPVKSADTGSIIA